MQSFSCLRLFHRLYSRLFIFGDTGEVVMRLPHSSGFGLRYLFHVVGDGDGVLARLVFESCVPSMSFDEFHLFDIGLHHCVMVGSPAIHVPLVGVSSPLE